MGSSSAVVDGGRRRHRWVTTSGAPGHGSLQHHHQSGTTQSLSHSLSNSISSLTGSTSTTVSCCGIAAIEAGLRRRMPLRRYLAGAPAASTSPTVVGGLFGGAWLGDSGETKSVKVGLGGCTTTAITSTASLGSRAMRYYRLWIYTCNTALLAGALAFIGTFTKMLLFDYRRYLVPSLTLYQPSFLYAYLALATQGGALQLLGCVAAVRLSERLLNAYWVLLLVLLFGDLVIGAFWAFRFETVCSDLKHTLKQRWRDEYTSNVELWDRFQIENSCCGGSGSGDYNSSNPNYRWDIPVPLSCCIEPITFAASIESNSTDKCQTNTAGCDEKLISYLKATASVLAILGYCVLAFLKLCFLGILRYEIREMIQKIRILRTELALLPAGVNGGVPGAGCNLRESAESERESLLLVRPDNALLLSSPPQPSYLQQQQAVIQQQQIQLIQQQQQQQQQFVPAAPPAAAPASNTFTMTTSGSSCSGAGGASAAAAVTTKTPNPNGNNNYEMREYHRSHENI